MVLIIHIHQQQQHHHRRRRHRRRHRVVVVDDVVVVVVVVVIVVVVVVIVFVVVVVIVVIITQTLPNIVAAGQSRKGKSFECHSIHFYIRINTHRTFPRPGHGLFGRRRRGRIGPKTGLGGSPTPARS